MLWLNAPMKGPNSMSLLSRIGLSGQTTVPQIILSEARLQADLDRPNREVVEAVRDYVSRACDLSYYAADELDPRCAQVLAVDAYARKVSDVGHAGYLGDAGTDIARDLPLVREALRAMRATPYQKLFDWMYREIEPHDIDQLPAAVLSELKTIDSAFKALRGACGLDVFTAGWIRGWKRVLIRPEADLPDAFAALAERNPLITTRRDRDAIARLAPFFVDTLQVGAGLALFHTDAPDLAGRLEPGTPFRVSASVEGVALPVPTLSGAPRIVMHGGDWLAIHERVSDDEAEDEARRRATGDIPSESSPDIAYRRWRHHGAGESCGSIPSDVVNAATEMASEAHLPLACHDLLRGAGLSASVTHAACITPAATIVSSGGKLSWMVRVGDLLCTLFLSESGVALYRQGSDQRLAFLSHADIEARFAALAD